MRIPETPTLRETILSIIETTEIIDNIRQAVTDGKIPASDGQNLIDDILTFPQTTEI